MIIYISGPIVEAHAAIEMANVLYADGNICFIPHIFWHPKLKSCETLTSFIEQNLVFLRQCECVLRLKGESVESDAEVAFAEEHEIPVFENYKELMTFIREG